MDVLFGNDYLDNLTDNFGVGAMQLINIDLLLLYYSSSQ